MYNELILIFHALFIGCSCLVALHLGQCALVAFISVLALLANLFVTKQTVLFGLTATCSDAFTIGAVLGLNVLQEYYGKKSAFQAIWTSFALLIFYTIVCQIHLWYLPAPNDITHASFAALLGHMPRITIASLSVYFLVQHIDAWLYGYLKTHWQTRYLLVRNYSSLAISQLIDTVLFSFLGLYGIVSNVGHIVIISYAIKLIAIALIGPFIVLSRKISYGGKQTS